MPTKEELKRRIQRGPGKEAGPAGGGRPQEPPKPWWSNTSFAIGAFLVFLLLQSLFFTPESSEIEFSRFLDLVKNERVTEVNIATSDISGEYRDGSGEGAETTPFTTTRPPDYEVNDLVQQLTDDDVKVTGEAPSFWGQLLISFLPFLIIIGIYLIIMRRMRKQMGGGPLSFGKNKAKLYDRADMKTTFEDVAGVDEVETELVELVEYLKTPEKFAKIGARIPRGVLLVGPPGTGKTLLARAVAGEAEVPFFYISASEFIEMFVGLGAARVRDLFKQARDRAPAIVFIDEIDSIGQSRSSGAGGQMGGHQEQEQTLQQLLTEMDGFEPNSGVIIVAASNRPEILDPALLRPGRFDRQIQVNLPDIRGREEILAIHARAVQLESNVDLKLMARRTPGFSGAELANVINEGALLAARRGKKKVSMQELEDAVDRVVGGLERRSQVLSEPERRLVAFHELGHALVAHFVEHADPVHRVSIIPRGIGALGYTQQLPEEERYLMSEPELRDRIAVLLGGRAAEELVFGYGTTGAQDDLRRATDIARRMVMEFGMSETVGPLNIADQGARFLSPAFRRGEDVSDETETSIDREVKAILVEAQQKAAKILADRRGDLDELAELLLEKESIGLRELKEHFNEPLGDLASVPAATLPESQASTPATRSAGHASNDPNSNKRDSNGGPDEQADDEPERETAELELP